METARAGDLDGAIDQSRAVVDDLFNSGEGVWTAVPTTVLVEALVQRGAEGDLQEAQAAIDRLAEISTEFPFEVPLLRLRALVARAGRRGWLPGVRGSLSGDGDVVRLRGAYGAGRRHDVKPARAAQDGRAQMW